MRLLNQRGDSRVYHATWQELISEVGRVDLMCVDAPYSEKTHKGHDAGALKAERARQWAASRTDEHLARPNAKHERKYARKIEAQRSKLEYAYWSPLDVARFVFSWDSKVTGWFVSLTDDQLAPYWKSALEETGRYVFSPVACVEPGSRVRMSGDGPSQWSCFAVIARPKSEDYSHWGAMPGAYVVPPGCNPRPANGGKAVTGGKPLWLMERLVGDYSKVGDVVCDPVAGAGTTLSAAVTLGRVAVGGDADLGRAEQAAVALDGFRQVEIQF